MLDCLQIFITKMVHNMRNDNKGEKVMELRHVEEDNVNQVPASGADVQAEPLEAVKVFGLLPVLGGYLSRDSRLIALAGYWWWWP